MRSVVFVRQTSLALPGGTDRVASRHESQMVARSWTARLDDRSAFIRHCPIHGLASHRRSWWPQAFAARRAQLAKTLSFGYFLLFARNEIPEATHYREDNALYYFTGLQDPGAVL